MKVTQYILDVLKTEKITHVFMVPGGYADPFLSTFAATPEVKPIVAAHEGGAAYMADGYARASGHFGVLLCVSGPGITNAVTGIATAFADQYPVMVISGQVPRQWEGRGAFQDSSSAGINDLDILRTITSAQLVITDVRVLEHHVERAFKRMLSHASRGPAHIGIPLDVQNIEQEFRPIKKIPEVLYQPRFVDQDACQQVWQYLNENKKILILAGSGVVRSNATEELIKFAEKFSIPVATTLAAKGVFPEDHPLSLGVLGWFGTRYANETILSEEVDVLIVLGSKLNQMDTLIWNKAFAPKKALILNDINTNSVFRNYQITLPVLGDCNEFLTVLNSTDNKDYEALLASKSDREQWLTKIHQAGPRYYHYEDCTSNLTPIHPAQAIFELRKVMPRDTCITVDSGAHAFFTGHYWDSYQPHQFFSSLNYMGPMGWGIAAGIGVKFAKPDAPCVIITGDGCMLMHGLEIQTAARHGLPLIIIVMNNSALGNVYLRAKKSGKFEENLAVLPQHNWAQFAESMGAVGMRVEKPEDLAGTFEKALSEKKTVLIDIICGNYPTPTEPFDESMRNATVGMKGGI